MKIGTFFPQLEFGTDPGLIREFGTMTEELGYDFLEAMEHIVGVSRATRPGFSGPYDHTCEFHEPFVLLSYIAAVTQRIELATAILVLPQRQTALVAKQTAELDVLSGGRVRLGVGIGWNRWEFEALGADFRTRGRRIEEQIALLRALWADPLVDFEGEWESVRAAGINPLPVQKHIPIWFGGMADPVLRRIGRMGDGWFPKFPSLDPLLLTKGLDRRHDDPKMLIEKMRSYAREAGRDPDAIGIEGRLNVSGRTPDEWRAEYEGWRDVGATHLNVFTIMGGLETPRDHLDIIRRVREELPEAFA
jgi:probable F420-dependent oxidoreductase